MYPDAPVEQGLEVLALGLFHFLVRLEHFVVGRGRHAVHAPGDGGGENLLLIFIGSPRFAGHGPDEACHLTAAGNETRGQDMAAGPALSRDILLP